MKNNHQILFILPKFIYSALRIILKTCPKHFYRVRFVPELATIELRGYKLNRTELKLWTNRLLYTPVGDNGNIAFIRAIALRLSPFLI